MTNPGDSDEWWKQYGGEGVSAESGGRSEPPPAAPPAGYSSAPQYQNPPVTPPPQPYPGYPAPPPPYQAPPAQQYGQPGYGQQQPGYGYQPYQGPGYSQQPQATGNNGLAIASLVLSLVGLFCCPAGIAGIVCGVMALNQIKERGGQGRGMALAGIIIATIGIALTVIIVAIDVATNGR
ncbi:DUF4190 domain-containing protein [Nocardia sp. alder85J]|uniref:DUF4190 domain-containing protein n=1 Tax=Nocardia sp. alder85J TaxID=2862949 RepID=UPI001CD396B5|nr:DUF4190 domain-containing protein [Nocardia sp. alder85J]MCX4093805.1 DUF4190 domain-containing protein [Nocardia sp. alder85J]